MWYLLRKTPRRLTRKKSRNEHYLKFNKKKEQKHRFLKRGLDFMFDPREGSFTSSVDTGGDYEVILSELGAPCSLLYAAHAKSKPGIPGRSRFRAYRLGAMLCLSCFCSFYCFMKMAVSRRAEYFSRGIFYLRLFVCSFFLFFTRSSVGI